MLVRFAELEEEEAEAVDKRGAAEAAAGKEGVDPECLNPGAGSAPGLGCCMAWAGG